MTIEVVEVTVPQAVTAVTVSIPGAQGPIGATGAQGPSGDRVNAVVDYAADNTGATNATTALKNFFDYCIANKKAGHIPAGSYLVTAGVLDFDNGHVETQFPDISTAGPKATHWNMADATNAPMFQLRNGTATSGSGKYWIGGSLGGITFNQNSKTKASGQHAISLRGVKGMRFGDMVANSMGGSMLHMPALLYGGSNPDPYAVWQCQFSLLEANYCDGRIIDNQNYVGFNGNHVFFARGIQNVLGGIYGLGAGNTIFILSMGSCSGWAIDDGTHSAATGGNPSRNRIWVAELDDVQYGIRLNRSLDTIISARFVHRHNFSVLNASEGYWPRKVMDLGQGTSPSLKILLATIMHRIESGGLKAAMGAFYALGGGGNVIDMQIDSTIVDNAGFSLADTELYSGNNTNSYFRLTRDGRQIIAANTRPASLMRGSSAGTALTIGTDPVTTTNGSANVNITMTGHGLVVGQCFTLQGAALTNGVPAAELNRSHPVTAVVDANTVTVAVETNATGTGAGGGASCTAAKDRSFLNALGLSGPKNKIALATESYDIEGHNSPTTYEWTAPYTGLFRVDAAIAWTGLSAGIRVQLAIYSNVHTSPQIAALREMRCQGANRETLQINAVMQLTAGDKIALCGGHNSTPGIAMSFTAANDVYMAVTAVH